jgi:hypothetical protein
MADLISRRRALEICVAWESCALVLGCGLGLLGSLESGRDGLMGFFDWGSAVASEPARGRGRGSGRAGDRPTLERGRRRESWVRRSGAGEPVQEER